MADFDNAFNTLQKGQDATNANASPEAFANRLKLSDLARQNVTQQQNFQDAQVARQSMQNRVITDPDTGALTLDVNGLSDDLMKQNTVMRNQLMKSLGTDDIDLANQRMQKNQQFVQQLAPDGSNLQEVKQAAIKAGLAKEWQGAPDYGGTNTVWAIKQGAQTLQNQIDNHMSMVKMKNDRFVEGVKKGVLPNEFLGGQEPQGLETGQQRSMPNQPSGGLKANSPMGYIIPMGEMDQNAQKAVDADRGTRMAGPMINTAKNDMLAVNKFNSMLDEYKGNYNEMPPAKLELAAGELGKLSAGGVPPVEMLRNLGSSNLPKQYAKFAEYMTGRPQPANNAEVVQMYRDYANDLKAQSLGQIKNELNTTLEYGRSKGLSDQSYEKYKANDAKYLQGLSQMASSQKQKSMGMQIPDGRVTVIGPDGVVGHIPKSQLKQALSQGYKQQ